MPGADDRLGQVYRSAVWSQLTNNYLCSLMPSTSCQPDIHNRLIARSSCQQMIYWSRLNRALTYLAAKDSFHSDEIRLENDFSRYRFVGTSWTRSYPSVGNAQFMYRKSLSRRWYCDQSSCDRSKVQKHSNVCGISENQNLARLVAESGKAHSQNDAKSDKCLQILAKEYAPSRVKKHTWANT